jgi:hypothetical protein
MKAAFSIPILGVLIAAGIWLYARDHERPGPAGSGGTGQPILVELFTSEGCSSCPPADQLLEKFDAQPVAGAQLIVLSEHVDYWNHIGWTDPYSSAAYSERQNHYGNRFHLESVYTPEMVVDGSSEFVGNSYKDAREAFERSQAKPKVLVHIRDLAVEDGKLRAHVDAGSLPAGSHNADVVFVVALSHADSQVARGENAGRHLTHVAVARSLNVIGTAESGKPFAKDISFTLGHDVAPSNLRVIAFLQESNQGRVLGAAQATLPN